MLISIDYLLSCLVLGLGIAIDVALASLAIGPFLKTAAAKRQWVTAVTATHITFPMIGYYGFALAYREFPPAQTILGLLAAVMVAWFLYHEFCELLEPDSDGFKGLSFLLVLAVSWDALWSGPAKSVQAVGWSSSEILWSFIIAGIVVGLTAYLATAFSTIIFRRFNKKGSISALAKSEVIALWLEFTVIGYFGLMSLVRYVLKSDLPWPYVASTSAVFWALVFYIQRRKLTDARMSELGGADNYL